jgi:YegS/Rv2252/BmrU family lipid kinase
MKKVLLIVNPVAGKMKAKTTLVDVLTELQKGGMCVTVQLTEHRGHAREMAFSAKENGYEMIICFGGDGTVNETISGIMDSGSDLPLGYIPAGSTNDFATSMKLSAVPKNAARAIAEGTEQRIDIGCFGGQNYFSYVAAFGVFTATSYNVPQDLKNLFGHLAYVLGSVKEIGNIRSYHAKIETDNAVIEDDYLFCAVANSTSVAGIVKLKEELVDMSDGLFEVGLIKNPKTIGELNKIINSLTTSNFSNGGVEFYKASKVTVTANEDLDWTLDGEHSNVGKTVVIENIKRAIRFVK